jgi:hypothetical protein
VSLTRITSALYAARSSKSEIHISKVPTLRLDGKPPKETSPADHQVERWTTWLRRKVLAEKPPECDYIARGKRCEINDGVYWMRTYLIFVTHCAPELSLFRSFFLTAPVFPTILRQCGDSITVRVPSSPRTTPDLLWQGSFSVLNMTQNQRIFCRGTNPVFESTALTVGCLGQPKSQK